MLSRYTRYRLMQAVELGAFSGVLAIIINLWDYTLAEIIDHALQDFLAGWFVEFGTIFIQFILFEKLYFKRTRGQALIITIISLNLISNATIYLLGISRVMMGEASNLSILLDKLPDETLRQINVTIFTLSIITALVYQLRLLVGRKKLWWYVIGKYNRPWEEERVFMFIDLKDSTTLTETMGNAKYFEFLNEYFFQMSDAIIRNQAEIYQYVGDEVVLTWQAKQGTAKNRCIQTFYDIKDSIAQQSTLFEKKFGTVPKFKAGLHVGKAIHASVGYLKKDIVYSGDVLNTTARIQSKCNTYQAEILLSRTLYEKLESSQELAIESVGHVTLKGKLDDVELLKVNSITP